MNFQTRINVFLRIVCFSVIPLIEGCFSYSPITPITNEGKNLRFPDPGQTIVIKRTDGSTIELQGYHYVAVNDSTDYVYGIGHYLNASGEEGETFRGKFIPVSVDSSHKVMFGMGINSGFVRCFDYTDAESLRVRFREGDVVTIPRGASPGIWYVADNGMIGLDKPFSGMIPVTDVSTIEAALY